VWCGTHGMAAGLASHRTDETAPHSSVRGLAKPRGPSSCPPINARLFVSSCEAHARVPCRVPDRALLIIYSRSTPAIADGFDALTITVTQTIMFVKKQIMRNVIIQEVVVFVDIKKPFNAFTEFGKAARR
jgi:hypothetical protein